MPEPDPDPEPDPEPDPDPPGAWGTAVPLHELPGSSQSQVLHVDPAGRALAMWQQTHATQPYYRLWASRKVDVEWEAPALVVADGSLGSELSVAGDVTTAQAAWLQSAGTARSIVTVQTNANGTWSPPTEHRSMAWDRGTLLSPRLAADDAHAVIVWGLYDPGSRRTTIEARVRKGSAEWSPLLSVVAGIDLASYSRPLYDLSFDDSGAIVVTWVERQPDRVELWARRGLPLAGSLSVAWESAQRVSMLVGEQSGYRVRELITGNHAGRSFAGWLAAAEDGTLSIATSHLRSDGAWEAEQDSGPIDTSHYAEPQFAAGAAGHKVAVWREPLDDSSRMLARTYAPELGWQETEVIADGLAPPYFGCIDVDAHYFDVSIDPDGNAIALWEERLPDPMGGRSRMGIWSSQFLVGTGWQPASRIDAGGGVATMPLVAAGPGTTATALFSAQAEDGATGLATNQLSPPVR